MSAANNPDGLSDARARLMAEIAEKDAMLQKRSRSIVDPEDRTVTVNRQALETLLATPPASTSTAIAAGEGVAWLHTLHMEHEQTSQWLTFSDGNPWGVPGQDYSAEYSVTSQPLYAAAPKAASEDGATGDDWRDMADAPKDGTLIRLRGGTTDDHNPPDGLQEREVTGWWDPDGYNQLSSSMGPGHWRHCTYDSDVYGEYGNPTGWKPVG